MWTALVHVGRRCGALSAVGRDYAADHIIETDKRPTADPTIVSGLNYTSFGS